MRLTIERKLRRRFTWRREWGVDKTIRGMMLFLMVCRGMTRREIADEIDCNDQELGRFLRRHDAEFERPNLLLDPACTVNPWHLLYWATEDICTLYDLEPGDVWYGRQLRRIRMGDPWWTIVALNL